MKKVLLLNPPSDRLCVKDYYCSFSSKAGYCWPPQDLVALSGILAGEYRVDYLDPYGRLPDPQGVKRVIADGAYAAAVFTTGSLNLSADLDFVREVKEASPRIKLIASGSVFHSVGGKIMGMADFLDAALLDFTNSDILNFLSGNFHEIKNMIYRQGGEIVFRRAPGQENRFSLPVPLHGLFNSLHYRLPFFVFKGREFVTTIASVGCPCKCSFCSASGIKYKARDVDNLMLELSALSRGGKRRNIFFADCNFTAGKERLHEICSRMRDDYRGLFSWICNSRPEPLLEMDTVRTLKRAGCRMVMLGAESADQRILDKYNKGTTPQEIKKAVDNCRKAGICTLLYFMLGLPGEDERSLRETADFIGKLGCDFISLSFAVPDFGTPLREESLKNGICRDELGGWDHSAGPYLSGPWKDGELGVARNRLYRNFYLRPSWIIRRLKDLSGLRPADFKEGVNVLKNWL